MRLATAIFLSVCAFALVIGLGWGGYHYWEKARAKQYESIKLWTVDARTNLQFSLIARTKLVDRRFFIKVDTDAYPSYLKDPILFAKNVNKAIILNFSDKDGFKVFSKPIPISALSASVDAAGKPAGLSFEGDEYMDLPTYASMTRLDVEWTVETAAPPVATTGTVPTEASQPLLDYCAPNLTKAERLKRLAQYGTVRQTGDGSYAVGYRTVAFFTIDNSLLNCR